MFLRTKIFRQLVLFALVPSLIIGLVTYYLLFEALDRAIAWISVSSPDRTINSLRLVESRLQELAESHLRQIDGAGPDSPDMLEWWVRFEKGRMVAHDWKDSWPGLDIPTLMARISEVDPGPVREMTGNYLILGAAIDSGAERVAGGFVLDREYLDGFSAATADLSERRQFINILPGLRMFLIVAGAAVLVVIVAVAYVFSRRLSRTVTTPLVRLTEATTAVAGGDYTKQIRPGGTDEVRRLTDTFNRMLTDLEDSRRRLIDAERVAAWQDFARRMAHELKNPLTPISLSLYRIKKTLQESGQYDRFEESIDAISSQVARLERMAGDYSALAKLPAPKSTTFDFTGMVNDLITLYRPQLDDHRFQVTAPDRPITVTADPDRLNQVMVNLFKNAIEFTPAGGTIALDVRADEQRIVFTLTNDSGDIDPDTLRSAKMPYYSTREGGSGLGLAVSDKIVVDHGGSLSLDVEDGMVIARFEIPRHKK